MNAPQTGGGLETMCLRRRGNLEVIRQERKGRIGRYTPGIFFSGVRQLDLIPAHARGNLEGGCHRQPIPTPRA